jgi:hypothetical protein
VAIMVDHLLRTRPEDKSAPTVFAKIDSDTMVPYGWLDETTRLMHLYPTVDFVGIEPHHPVLEGPRKRALDPCRHIGGIGVMRTRAFEKHLPRPNGRFGFTEFQTESSNITKAWINPSLPVFLLDHLPLEPWMSLSQKYVENGWQRDPGWLYKAEYSSHIWAWFCK